MTDSRLFDQDSTGSAPVAERDPADRDPAGRADDEHLDFGDEDEFDAREYVRMTRPAGPARKIIITAVGVVVVLGVIVGGFGLWLQRQINPPGGPGQVMAVAVESGSTVDDIVDLLSEEGVVSNPTVFRYYLRWRGVDSFQAGEYSLAQNSAFDDVITALEAGPAPRQTERFTVPEGLTIDEMAERLGSEIEGIEADDIAGALIRMDTPWRPGGENSWEGLLFPDTYDYETGDDARSILERMNRQFDSVARSVGLDPAMGVNLATLERQGLTAYDYIIIASMIEKEARLPEEHALMSRVIHNRLEIGMTLGIDATVIYARGPEREGEPITDADLAIDSPYNTRLNPGLPPTPIAAPSRSALEAALNPADGPWLYYVLAGADGSHFFTDDYDEFLRVRDESRAAGLF